GYTYVNLTIQDYPATYSGVVAEIKRFKALCAPHADWLCFAPTMAEIDKASADQKLAIGLNVQDTALIHDDVSAGLDVMLKAGVRHMLLAYQLRNRAADGCAEPGNAGLSLFGESLVRAMNAVGMVVDLSHVGKRSTLDAMSISDRPVIFSHSGVKALCRHIRNIDDEQIKACAATGGVVGIVGIGAFLGDPAMQAETFFQNVDHIVQLVGPEHVGIGTDYIDDMPAVWPSMIAGQDTVWRDPYGTQLYEGVAFSPEQLLELVERMLQAGYSDAAIRGVLGENFYRIYRDEEIARHGGAQLCA
ncbi:MAG: membrane dipeptidase, partial [Pseudomonadota bacterium]